MNIADKLLKTCPYPAVFDGLKLWERPKPELGYFRCDYDGYKWWNTVWPVNVELETDELIAEFDSVYDAFLDTFPTLSVLKEYCEQNLLPTDSPTEFNAYLDLGGPGW